jgi:hypothetical protein
VGRLEGNGFADAWSDPRKFVIEAEDFDFSGGSHRAIASVMPYLGGASEGLAGGPGVDFLRTSFPETSQRYRSDEQWIIPTFQQNEVSRRDRGTWVLDRNYSLAYVETGQWFNYTRKLPRAGYRVWLAAASPDLSAAGISGRLQKVTMDATTSHPVVEDLGVFEGPGSGSWSTLAFVPLKPQPSWELLDLGEYGEGTTTLRFVPIRGDADFLLFQPAVHVDPATRLVASIEPSGRWALTVLQGLVRPVMLQGTPALGGDGGDWHELTRDFSKPFLVPEGSPDRFFRLILE